MKTRLLFAAVPSIVAITSVHAADLPVKAKPVEYVKICSLYGAGFYYVPGSDTCIKFGGYLRSEFTVGGNNQNGPAWNGSNGAQDRFAHDFFSRSRFQFSVDMRTATQYGVVRTFGTTDYQFDTYGTAGGINPSALATASAAGGLLNYTPGGGYVVVEQLFVQFAGFTFGKSLSARNLPWNSFVATQNSAFLLGGPDYFFGVNNIQYTYQWGNGISTSIGVDEPVVFNRTAVGNVLTPAGASAVTAFGAVPNSYAGQSIPDVVGNFKIDQAWGIFMLAGNIHEVRAAYYSTATAAVTANELSGHPDSKIGGSASAGLQLKNIPTGTADMFTVDATYARGDTKTVIGTSVASPSFAMFGKGIPAATYQSLGFGFTSDGIYSGTSQANGTPIELTTAYGARAGFIHNWSPQWQSNLFGSYSAVRYNNTATNLICTNYGRNFAGLNTTYRCNPDFNVMQVGLRTGWTPVPGMTFSGEVFYVLLDQKFSGIGTFAAAPSAALAKPPGNYNFKDQETLSVNFRAQRNF